MVKWKPCQLDYIWHGFHFTNMIPYRFSFLHSFVLLYMAYRAWTLRREYTVWHILLATSVTVFFLSCSNDLLTMTDVELLGMELELPVYIIYNVSFLLLYVVSLIYGCFRRAVPGDLQEEEREEVLGIMEMNRDYRIANARLLLLAFFGIELMAGLTSFGLYFPGTGVSNYPRGTTAAASMIRYMHEREDDTLFYRAETTHSQTLNDGALNNYNGVSTFTSSANVKVTEFMRALGYGAKNTYNRYCFEESSPVANLFLNLKYMIEREGKDKASAFFTDVHHFKDVHLLENTAYLPLGFLADRELANVDFLSSSGKFDFQNQLFTAATGLQPEVWYRLQGQNTSIVGTGVTITESTGTGFCDYRDATKGSTITYSYIVDRSGFCCIHLNLPKRNDYHVMVNGVELYRETISLPQMIAVGDVREGDLLDIRIECDAGEDSNMTVIASVLDNNLFRVGYEKLAACPLELMTFTNTLVEGTVDCDRDGLLYTSIPQNGNWTAEIDGIPAEITLVGDAMIGLQLTEGEHTVSFRYHNAAFSLGWKITAVCAAIFMLLIWWQSGRNTRMKKGRFQK